MNVRKQLMSGDHHVCVSLMKLTLQRQQTDAFLEDRLSGDQSYAKQHRTILGAGRPLIKFVRIPADVLEVEGRVATSGRLPILAPSRKVPSSVAIFLPCITCGMVKSQGDAHQAGHLQPLSKNGSYIV